MVLARESSGATLAENCCANKAIVTYQKQKTPDAAGVFCIWSGKPGSNWRPVPWQGTALPTELFPLFCYDLRRIALNHFYTNFWLVGNQIGWRPLGESNPCCQDENLES